MVWEAFSNKGLEEYVIYYTPEYEIALQKWESKEAADAAFASSSGQMVAEDALAVMEPLVFKEVNRNPF
jgi:hypothetical protein